MGSSNGENTDRPIETGHRMWIPTGGMLPQGANGVVMVEYTEKLDESILYLLTDPWSPGKTLCIKGEDIKKKVLFYIAPDRLLSLP